MRSPFKYWVDHAIIATIISIVTLSPAAGIAFYAGREIAQYEENGWFDWKGFLAPLAVLIPPAIVEFKVKLTLLLMFLQ